MPKLVPLSEVHMQVPSGQEQSAVYVVPGPPVLQISPSWSSQLFWPPLPPPESIWQVAVGALASLDDDASSGASGLDTTSRPWAPPSVTMPDPRICPPHPSTPTLPSRANAIPGLIDRNVAPEPSYPRPRSRSSLALYSRARSGRRSRSETSKVARVATTDAMTTPRTTVPDASAPVSV